MSLFKRPLRTYVDTTVFGGILDEEFTDHSREFFREVRLGRFMMVVSPVGRQEVSSAPQAVQALWAEMMPFAELVSVNEDTRTLAQAYLDAKVIRAKCRE